MTNDAKSDLPVNKRNAIAALLSGSTKEAAATAAGVTPPTLSRWLADEHFRRELRRRAERALSDASWRLKRAADSAAQLLAYTMHNQEYPIAIRLKAAQLTLDYAIKLNEQLDLTERVAALEERANEPK